MLAFAPVNGAASSAMLAIGGQTLQDMIDNASDVDGAFDSSRTNILCTFAGTNGMMPTGGAVQAERMRTYIAARKAANPGLIVVVGNVLPRYEGTGIPERFAETLVYNQILEANWRTWGASAFVDLRPKGSAFDLPDASLASFTRAATLPMWSTADPANTYTHLADPGAAHVARLFNQALTRILPEGWSGLYPE
jgi:hypothetical protein